MSTRKIIAVYAHPFLKRPYRFVVRSTQPAGPEMFDLHKFNTRVDLVSALLDVLGHRDGFGDALQAIDADELAKSSHRSRRYVAERREDIGGQAARMVRWYVTRPLGKTEAMDIVRMACKAANVRHVALRMLDMATV